MTKIFDEVLNQEVEIHDVITPEIGKDLKIEDPPEIKEIFKDFEEENKDA